MAHDQDKNPRNYVPESSVVLDLGDSYKCIHNTLAGYDIDDDSSSGSSVSDSILDIPTCDHSEVSLSEIPDISLEEIDRLDALMLAEFERLEIK